VINANKIQLQKVLRTHVSGTTGVDVTAEIFVLITDRIERPPQEPQQLNFDYITLEIINENKKKTELHHHEFRVKDMPICKTVPVLN